MLFSQLVSMFYPPLPEVNIEHMWTVLAGIIVSFIMGQVLEASAQGRDLQDTCSKSLIGVGCKNAFCLEHTLEMVCLVLNHMDFENILLHFV